VGIRLVGLATQRFAQLFLGAGQVAVLPAQKKKQ
jgi:hypothetical protein